MRNIISVIMPEILSWKKLYGSVYYIKISDSEYVFRPLTKGEYVALLSIQENMGLDNSDMIMECCLLYPIYDVKFFDNKLAGEIDRLIECIVTVSGFSNSDQTLVDIESSRNSVETLDNQITMVICRAFPGITPKDINNLSYEEIIRYLSISEMLLDIKINIEKPKQKKPGTIDFDEENKEMGSGPVPFGKTPISKSRGDVGK